MISAIGWSLASLALGALLILVCAISTGSPGFLLAAMLTGYVTGHCLGETFDAWRK